MHPDVSWQDFTVAPFGLGRVDLGLLKELVVLLCQVCRQPKRFRQCLRNSNGLFDSLKLLFTVDEIASPLSTEVISFNHAELLSHAD